MTKILLVGASSFLGTALYAGFSNDRRFLVKGTYLSSYVNDSFIKLDITSLEEIRECIQYEQADYIIWVAGNKDVKKCQYDYDFAYKINTKPVIDLISCLNVGHKGKNRVIFISTDYIFDGQRGGYTDTDTPAPVTNYGQTNFLAENALFESDVDFKIVRTAAVMGRGGQFWDWLLQALTTGNQISLYNNIFFSPTPTNLFVDAMMGLINHYEILPQKIIHIVGAESMSRYTFGTIVARLKRSSAVLLQERADLRSSLFQQDLSLFPSKFMQKYNAIPLEDRIAYELRSYMPY